MRTLLYLTTNGAEKDSFGNFDLNYNYSFSANNGMPVIQSLTCMATENTSPTTAVPSAPNFTFSYQHGKEELNVTRNGKDAVDSDLYDHVKAEFETILDKYIPTK